MTGTQDATPAAAWQARPVLAGTLRAALLAVPLVASTGSVLLLSRLLPTGAGRTWWGLTCLLVVAVTVTIAVERVARRLLPIALLLKLSMIFPDRAPSRFKLARSLAVRTPGSGQVRHGPDDEPTSTADLVLGLVSALGTHDRRTRGHSERVRLLCEVLAEELKLDSEARDRLRWAALLHDVGKMRVSTSILNKPGRLDAGEFERIKHHPVAGAELAAPLMPWLGEWGDGILDHHEKYDGSGYPSGKAGTQISQAGRLIGLIDAFETMTAARPYKKAMATRAAREELARCAGTHFDPVMVRAFLAISLPRLLWAMGPASVVLQLPFLRPLADVGARAGVVAPQAAATTLATGAASAAVAVSGGLGVLAPATGMGELHADRDRTTTSAAAVHGLAGPPVPVVAARVAAAQSEVPVPPLPEPQLPVPPLPEPQLPPAAEPAPAPDTAGEPATPVGPPTGLREPEAPPAPPAAGTAAPDIPPVGPPTGLPVETPPAEVPPVGPPTGLPAEVPPVGPPTGLPPVVIPPAPVEEPVALPDPLPTPGATPPVVVPEPELPPLPAEPLPVPTSDTPTVGIGEPVVPNVLGTGPAIASGPASPSRSLVAAFTLRAVDGVQWQCQVLGNGTGQSSAWNDCPSGPFTVTLVRDGESTLKVRDAAGSNLTDSWSWTVATSPGP